MNVTFATSIRGFSVYNEEKKTLFEIELRHIFLYNKIGDRSKSLQNWQKQGTIYKSRTFGGEEMKKILWVLLALALLLTACGTEKTPETTEPLIVVEIPYEEPVATLPYTGVELTFRAIWQEQEPQALAGLQRLILL